MKCKTMFIGVIILLALLNSKLVIARADGAKDKDIRKLLIMTGSDKLALQVMNQIIDQFKKMAPEVPEKYWMQIKKEVKGEEFVEMTIPIYARHFNHDEIKQIISFYETPTGAKLVKEMPFVVQESMTAGQDWGQKLSKKIIQKLKKNGYGKAL